jgi:hypothetical protein
MLSTSLQVERSQETNVAGSPNLTIRRKESAVKLKPRRFAFYVSDQILQVPGTWRQSLQCQAPP